jgi:hypothetical protein
LIQSRSSGRLALAMEQARLISSTERLSSGCGWAALVGAGDTLSAAASRMMSEMEGAMVQQMKLERRDGFPQMPSKSNSSVKQLQAIPVRLREPNGDAAEIIPVDPNGFTPWAWGRFGATSVERCVLHCPKGFRKTRSSGRWTKGDKEITARPSPVVGAEAGASVTAPTQRWDVFIVAACRFNRRLWSRVRTSGTGQRTERAVLSQCRVLELLNGCEGLRDSNANAPSRTLPSLHVTLRKLLS